MTNKEYAKSINKRVKNKGINGDEIEINYPIPSVSVCDFYSQGEDAATLLEEATNISNKTGLTIKSCLVFLLDSAGAL